MMYALWVNRGLSSPSGVDYKARADFWFDYLKNNFEAKWRDRNNVSSSSYDFMTPNNLTHSNLQFIRYFYYMGQVSGDSGYLNQAQKIAALIDNNLVRTSSPDGTALVWCQGITSIDPCYGAQATNYVRYTVSGAVDLGLEGMAPFNQSGYLEMFAHTVANFMLDNGTTNMAPNVTGGVDRAGVPGADGSTVSMFFYQPLSILTAFDSSGKLADTSIGVYDNIEPSLSNPDNMEIPTGMLLNAMIN